MKRISIEQLVPGMFIVEMDVPWYRTPFLSHKRLIKDQQTIALMQQHGIRTVTIDTEKGADLPSESSPTTPPVASPPPPMPIASTVSDPPRAGGPDRSADEQAVTVLYAQAHEAVERIFADLERGLPPSPEATKALVSNVLAQVLSNRAAMTTQVAIQKIKQFDRSLTTHALDTCILSLVVAIESGLDLPTQEVVGMGAVLHDVGYVRLPRNVVRKRDACTGPDKTLLEQHCTLGAAVLAEAPGMPDEVLRIVREHHERADGSGFPSKLRDDQVSRLAQIIGVVDFYDGMVSRRGTRPGMIPHDAVRQLFLVGERGQFDKALVERLIRSIGVYPVGSFVQLNTGEQAVVVGVNPQHRLKPLVKVTTDPQGKSYPTPIAVDLASSSPTHTVCTVVQVLDPTRARVDIGMYLDQPPTRAA